MMNLWMNCLIPAAAGIALAAANISADTGTRVSANTGINAGTGTRVSAVTGTGIKNSFSGPAPEFEAETIDDQVAIGYGLATGDVDGDGKTDILLADKTEIVWYRNGDWKRFVMAKDLTARDNVCIAARDINGDGIVEVAVGAQWNPGETSDTSQSGAVFYLSRPDDPTLAWTPLKLHHEPTVHRMRWALAEPGRYQLIVLPLHGRGNKNGEGDGVRVMAYEPPENAGGAWNYKIIDRLLHMSHNLEIVPDGDRELVYVGGKEGVRKLRFEDGQWAASWLLYGQSFGELRVGHDDQGSPWLAGIEPMHGNNLTVYPNMDRKQRKVLTEDMNQGHALAVADLTGTGSDQIVAGWRNPNQAGKVGIQLWQLENGTWTAYPIDDNTMACEDLRVADLDGDGRPEIIAAGRATGNLIVYWNRGAQ